MHISSLPGPYGIGTMGDNAYRFVDCLQRAGQTWWQILPIGPTSYVTHRTSRSARWRGTRIL